MSKFNLRRIDLNLLVIFESVYEEKNQRKAAERLFLTQPSVSSAISRLRGIVNDKLFHMTSTGLVPTTKSDEIYKTIHAALDIIRNGMDSGEHFEAENSQRTFKVSIDYGSGAAIAFPLVKKLRQLAPLAKLRLESINSTSSQSEMLVNNSLDCIISQHRLDDNRIETVSYQLHSGVFIARTDHPRINPDSDIEALTEEDFVLVSGQPMTYDLDQIDSLLARIKDRVVLEVPTAAVIPSIIKNSDFVSLISKQTLLGLDYSEGIQIIPLPWAFERGTTYVNWSREADSGSIWFKKLVLEVLNELADAPSNPNVGTD